jgi:hypothetical protein
MNSFVLYIDDLQSHIVYFSKNIISWNYLLQNLTE